MAGDRPTAPIPRDPVESGAVDPRFLSQLRAATIASRHVHGPTHEPAADDPVAAGELETWSGEDLDCLYRQALDAMDAVASDLSDACSVLSAPESADDDAVVEAAALVRDADSTSDPDGVSHFTRAPDSVPSATTTGQTIPSDESPVTAEQIIEAALFVGGTPLTAKRLCSLLRGDFDPDFVDRTIEELNRRYSADGRPYEIRLGEGGYRLVLKQEFATVGDRVHGAGPREVRLSPDALEVLALVAYGQPASRADIEAAGKDNAGAILRQLLRRELVAIERRPDDPDDVRYRTTRRFLDLFGLGRLDELPRADELDLK